MPRSTMQGTIKPTDQLKALCRNHFPRVVELRHHFHKHPELGHQEFGTARIVADELRRLGIEVTEKVEATGVVGILKGAHPGRTLMLRADMDALPIQENTGLDYKSVVPGQMHACGHDGHTANLLGVAMVLSQLKDQLHGTVKFIFQPDEEYDSGAKAMIQLGVLENPTVDAAFGLHFWGSVPEGQVHIKGGPFMAAPDKFTFRVIGKGGHAAMPHLCVDPVLLTVQAINAMQTIISRKKSPFVPAVISYCSLHAPSEYNTIPDEVTVTGTIRTFDADLRNWIITEMEATLKGITESQGARYTFEIAEDFALPAVVNDHELANLVRQAARKVVDPALVIEPREPSMGAEDFSYFSQKVPSCFFFVGIAPAGTEVVHHSPEFQWDDRNLETAMLVMSQAAVDYLRGTST
ncbi:MAG: amidohydrolase [Spirochaetia bacterium]|nr:amidohydrolase [Spirochaetia bacterium]